MVMKSIFEFLEEKYSDTYANCTLMEKRIARDDFEGAVQKSRHIGENIAQKFVDDSSRKCKLEFEKKAKTNRHIDQGWRLSKLNDYKEFPDNSKRKVVPDNFEYYSALKDINKIGNDASHDNDIEFNYDDAIEIHKKVYNICFNFYNYNEIPIDYNYSPNLDFYKNNNETTPKEFKVDIESIHMELLDFKELINKINEGHHYEVNNLKGELFKLTKQLNNLEKDNEDLMEEIEQNKNYIKCCENDINDLNEENKNLNTENKQFKENLHKIRDFENEIDRKNVLINDLNRKIENQEDEIKSIKKEVSKDKVISEDDVKKLVKYYTGENLRLNNTDRQIKNINNVLIKAIENIDKNYVKKEDLNNLNIDDSFKDFLKETFSEIIKNKLEEYKERNLNHLKLTSDEYGEDVIIDLPNYEVVEVDGVSSFKEKKFKPNSKQEQAITYAGFKPLAIDAGPGSGKTRVIIERVAHLIKNENRDPNSFLIITFTNKAADELRERFLKYSNLDGNTINKMRIGTIHSFCRSIISKYESPTLNLLIRNGEEGLFIQKHLKELGFTGEAFLFDSMYKQVLNKYNDFMMFGVNTEKLIKHIKNEHTVSTEYLDYLKENPRPNFFPYNYIINHKKFKLDYYYSKFLRIAESYPKFLEIMERENSCNQNYLLIKAEKLLKNEEILKRIPYTNIFIDEFQDTDPIQYNLFYILQQHCLNKRGTFTVVGDIDQSIYGWRGAYPRFFLKYLKSNKFEKVELDYNYRSTKDIIYFNEKFIEDVRETSKVLKSVRDFKMPVYKIGSNDYNQQAKNIVYTIKKLKENGKIEKYGDIGIISRSVKSKYVEELIKELDTAKIPFYIPDRNDLINQDETQAILTLFNYMADYRGNDLLGFTDKRYNSSKIFKLSKNTRKILLKLNKKMEKNKLDINFSNFSRYDLENEGITNQHDLDFFTKLNKLKKEYYEGYKPTNIELYNKLLKITGYYDEILEDNSYESEKAVLNLGLISDIINDYGNIMDKRNLRGMFKYLRKILGEYSCPINEKTDHSNEIQILTAHKSKGLEFPVVIVYSLKNKVFPNTYNAENESSLYDFNGWPRYPVPHDCYKYKPSSLKTIEKNYDMEELRNVYVACTRAKDLLILSIINNKKNNIPPKLNNFERKYWKITNLTKNNIDKIKHIRTSHRNANKNNRHELDFSAIINNYIFCPYKYRVIDIFKHKFANNNILFLNNVLHNILNSIFNLQSNINNVNDVEKLIDQVIKSYDNPNNDLKREFSKIRENILLFWQEKGQEYYDTYLDNNISRILKLDISYIKSNIDLIIENDDGAISIIQFIVSTKEIEDMMSEYLKYLNFYSVLLENDEEYKDYKIKDIKLHSFMENKTYVVNYNNVNNFMITRSLNDVSKEILYGTFDKNRGNCENCSLKEHCN